MIRIIVDFLGVIAEIGMLYYLYENLLIKRSDRQWWYYGIYCLAGVLFMFFSTYIEQPRLRTWLYLIVIVLLPAVLYKSKWYINILTGFMYGAIQTVVEMVIKAVFLSVSSSMSEYYELSVLLSKMLALCIIFMIVSSIRVRARILSLRLFLALLIMPAATMVIIYQLIDISYALNTQSGYIKLMVISILMIGVNIAMCYLFGRLSEVEEMRWRAHLVHIQEEAKQKHYLQLANHQQEVRYMYHDMERHLRLIGSYLVDGQIEQAMAYIRQQNIQIDQMKLTVTGYGLIDSLLTAKKELAQKQNVKLEYETHWSPNLSLPEEDITLILDNGLDNAIEAAAKLNDASQRWVMVILSQRLPLLHMIIRNPVEQAIDTRQEKLKTKKEDAQYHGMGMDNMQRLAEKHGGTILYDCENRIFILRAMVKISNCRINATDTGFVPKPYTDCKTDVTII